MIILDKIKNIDYKTVITIGNFDGVHIGHEYLIKKTKYLAQKMGAKSLVFTFWPNTKQVLFDKNLKTILTLSERRFVLKKFDVDFLLEHNFNVNFSRMSSNDFFELLLNSLNCVALVVGEDYSFGKDNINLLKHEYKNKIIIQPEIKFGNQEKHKISSSYIRQLISDRNIEQANKFLTENYFIMSKVVYGKKRNISVPTINFVLNKNKLLPPDGVYQTKTLVNKKIYQSLTNIGYNPTVQNKFRSIETHILDFSGDIYGQTVIVYFEKFLRNEIKFGSVNELQNQIKKDLSFVKSQEF